jgi:NDP-sugar pyrophosphorylase family protein
MAGLSGAIIAAGRGERLRGAAGGIPKPLVELAGEAMVTRQARAMLSMGARPVHVIVNTETAGLMQERGVALPEAVELMVRDTANSMESLLSLGERIPTGRFVLATVDAVAEEGEFRRFVAHATKMTDPGSNNAVDGALGVVRWRGDRKPLFVRTGDGNLIAGLGESDSPIVTAGVYLFSTEIFAYGAEARALGLGAMRQFLAYLLTKQMRFAAIQMNQVVDVDEGEDLAAARAIASRGRQH